VSGELVPPKKYGKGGNLCFVHATIMLQLFLGKTKKGGSDGITARAMNLQFYTATYIYMQTLVVTKKTRYLITICFGEGVSLIT
jgi:hypothetical protein